MRRKPSPSNDYFNIPDKLDTEINRLTNELSTAKAEIIKQKEAITELKERGYLKQTIPHYLATHK